jgi:hypothetical protein
MQSAVQKWLHKQQKKELPWSLYDTCEVLDDGDYVGKQIRLLVL